MTRSWRVPLFTVAAFLVVFWYGTLTNYYSTKPERGPPSASGAGLDDDLLYNISQRDSILSQWPWSSQARKRPRPAPVPRRKVILFSTQPYLGSKHFAKLPQAEALCPACIFTDDHSLWDQADAVLFNGDFLPEKPPARRAGREQIWIYYYREAVTWMRKQAMDRMDNYKQLFNWTMSYRRDSDVWMPYAHVWREQEEFDEEAVLKRFGNKTKLIAWIVSNCNSQSERGQLVTNLQAHIPVDVYGKCGPLKCAKDRAHSLGTDCRQELAKSYRFYFAAENSLCQDYVTEKFYDVLETDMVPIVYSAVRDYEVLGIPNGSYINVADFSTVKELADQILWLSEHPAEYVAMLKARAGIKKSTATEIFWCRICEKLYAITGPNSTGESHSYEDVREWWRVGMDAGRPMCPDPPKMARKTKS